MKILCALLALILASSVSGEEMRVLHLAGEKGPNKVLMVLSDQGKLSPSIKDKYEKDPFGRAENDVYEYTAVSCRQVLFFSSALENIAFKNPYTTVIGLTFISENKKITMQGNWGMSVGNKILKEKEFTNIEFVSLSPIKFSSRKLAKEAVADGLCDLMSATKVEQAGVMGEVMFESETKWRPLSRSLMVVTG